MSNNSFLLPSSLPPQNLAEAEYAVGLFMFMRLQGYPPDKIAILTTYNGQKHLIRDVLAKRCANNPVFGLPEQVRLCRDSQWVGPLNGVGMSFAFMALETAHVRVF